VQHLVKKGEKKEKKERKRKKEKKKKVIARSGSYGRSRRKPCAAFGHGMCNKTAFTDVETYRGAAINGNVPLNSADRPQVVGGTPLHKQTKSLFLA
jgi:hypothetical protein